MRPDQRWMLFLRTAERLGLQVEEALRPIVDRLTDLTAGDVAAVVRKARLLGIRDARGLIEALAEERRMKPGLRKEGIGFSPRA